MLGGDDVNWKFELARRPRVVAEEQQQERWRLLQLLHSFFLGQEGMG